MSAKSNEFMTLEIPACSDHFSIIFNASTGQNEVAKLTSTVLRITDSEPEGAISFRLDADRWLVVSSVHHFSGVELNG